MGKIFIFSTLKVTTGIDSYIEFAIVSSVFGPPPTTYSDAFIFSFEFIKATSNFVRNSISWPNDCSTIPEASSTKIKCV